MVKPLAVVAVGGNALIQDEQRNSIPDQYVAVMESVQHIVDMVEAGWDLVLTHGNGPQVGFILRRSELPVTKFLRFHLITPWVIHKVLLATCSRRHCITNWLAVA